MASLAVLDHVVALVEREIGPPRVTYNKITRITSLLAPADTTSAGSFRAKSTPHCHTRLKTGSLTREVILRQLEDAGIGATPFQSELITIKLLQKHLDDSRAIMLDVLSHCERQSKTDSEQAV